jgi:hypothetical protein
LTLSNGIDIWEDPNSILPALSTPQSQDQLASLSWGILPLLSFLITMILGILTIRGPFKDVNRNEP